MFNHSTVVVAAGSLCLDITLVLAWRLAGVRESTFMKRLSLDDRSWSVGRAALLAL